MTLVDSLIVALLASAIAVLKLAGGGQGLALAALGVSVAAIYVFRGRWQAAAAIPVGVAIAGFAATGLSSMSVIAGLSIATVLLGGWLWARPVPRLPTPGGPHQVGLTRFIVQH